jgi:hypothetical protein
MSTGIFKLYVMHVTFVSFVDLIVLKTTHHNSAKFNKENFCNSQKMKQKHKTSSIYDSTYAWRDNVLTLKTCTGTYRNKW